MFKNKNFLTTVLLAAFLALVARGSYRPKLVVWEAVVSGVCISSLTASATSAAPRQTISVTIVYIPNPEIGTRFIF